jgi:hypothetical protein
MLPASNFSFSLPQSPLPPDPAPRPLDRTTRLELFNFRTGEPALERPTTLEPHQLTVAWWSTGQMHGTAVGLREMRGTRHTMHILDRQGKETADFDRG